MSGLYNSMFQIKTVEINLCMLGQWLFICEQQVSSRWGVLASCCFGASAAPPAPGECTTLCFRKAGLVLFLRSAAGNPVCVLEGFREPTQDVRRVCQAPFPSLRAAVVARPTHPASRGNVQKSRLPASHSQ